MDTDARHGTVQPHRNACHRITSRMQTSIMSKFVDMDTAQYMGHISSCIPALGRMGQAAHMVERLSDKQEKGFRTLDVDHVGCNHAVITQW